MAYVIAEPCIDVKDHACVDACPVDCIHPAKDRDYHGGPETRGTKNFDEVPQLYIDPVECIDCSACVPVCPVIAIFALDDLPEKWANYTQNQCRLFQASGWIVRDLPEEWAGYTEINARVVWNPLCDPSKMSEAAKLQLGLL